MRVNDVYILEEAVNDLNEGKSFYDFQETGVGDYFWDCLIADIESLIIYAGIHRKKLGFYQMFAKRFPYAIYYKLQDNDIDFPDNPEVTPEMFAKAIVRKGLKPVRRKTQITLRIDEDVLTWFKKQGTGYQTRINSLLKAYKEAHQDKSTRIG